MDQAWRWLDDAGRVQGPLPLAALRRMARDGAITAVTQVHHAAMGWRPLGSVLHGSARPTPQLPRSARPAVKGSTTGTGAGGAAAGRAVGGTASAGAAAGGAAEGGSAGQQVKLRRAAPPAKRSQPSAASAPPAAPRTAPQPAELPYLDAVPQGPRRVEEQQILLVDDDDLMAPPTAAPGAKPAAASAQVAAQPPAKRPRPNPADAPEAAHQGVEEPRPPPVQPPQRQPSPAPALPDAKRRKVVALEVPAKGASGADKAAGRGGKTSMGGKAVLSRAPAQRASAPPAAAPEPKVQTSAKLDAAEGRAKGKAQDAAAPALARHHSVPTPRGGVGDRAPSPAPQAPANGAVGGPAALRREASEPLDRGKTNPLPTPPAAGGDANAPANGGGAAPGRVALSNGANSARQARQALALPRIADIVARPKPPAPAVAPAAPGMESAAAANVRMKPALFDVWDNLPPNRKEHVTRSVEAALRCAYEFKANGLYRESVCALQLKDLLDRGEVTDTVMVTDMDSGDATTVKALVQEHAYQIQVMEAIRDNRPPPSQPLVVDVARVGQLPVYSSRRSTPKAPLSPAAGEPAGPVMPPRPGAVPPVDPRREQARPPQEAPWQFRAASPAPPPYRQVNTGYAPLSEARRWRRGNAPASGPSPSESPLADFGRSPSPPDLADEAFDQPLPSAPSAFQRPQPTKLPARLPPGLRPAESSEDTGPGHAQAAPAADAGAAAAFSVLLQEQQQHLPLHLRKAAAPPAQMHGTAHTAPPMGGDTAGQRDRGPSAAVPLATPAPAQQPAQPSSATQAERDEVITLNLATLKQKGGMVQTLKALIAQLEGTGDADTATAAATASSGDVSQPPLPAPAEAAAGADPAAAAVTIKEEPGAEAAPQTGTATRPGRSQRRMGAAPIVHFKIYPFDSFFVNSSPYLPEAAADDCCLRPLPQPDVHVVDDDDLEEALGAQDGTAREAADAGSPGEAQAANEAAVEMLLRLLKDA